MPTIPIEKLGLGGLNTDNPKETMDLAFFDKGNNMRSKEGGLIGVNSWNTEDASVRLFQQLSGTIYPVELESIRPYSSIQWTLSGSPELQMLTAGIDDAGDGAIYLTGGGRDNGVVSDFTLPYAFDYNISNGFNSFIFNEVAIFNPTTEGPMYSNDRENFYRLPNWFGEMDGVTLTTVTDKEVYQITTVILADWSSVGAGTSAAVGDVFTASSTSPIVALGDVELLIPYTAVRMCPYNGRLIAVNMFNDLADGDPLNDINSPIEIAYSNSIANIGSIANLEWYAAATNTAGNAFLTNTPGVIKDCKQLGEYLMIYKTDSVFRMIDSGDPLFLTGETAFLDDGIMATDCVVDIGKNQHFVVGNYSIYIHSGGPEKATITSDKVVKAFFGKISKDVDDKALTFVFNDSYAKEVWVCYRSEEADKNALYKGCTNAIVFNYDEGTFYEREVPNITSIFETEINGSISIIATSLDNPTGSLSDGYLYTLSSNYEPDGYLQWTARNLGMPDSVKEVRTLFPASELPFEVAIVGSDTNSEPDMNSATYYTFDPSSDYKLDFRELGRYITMRFRIKDSNSPNISGAQIEADKSGIR